MKGVSAPAAARVFAAVVLAGLASGCAARVQSSVEGFAAGDAIRPGDRVMVVPAVEQGSATLEQGTWVQLAEAQFSKRSVAVTRSPEEATVVAGIRLGLDAGRDVASSFAVPQYGVTGYSGASTVGTVTRYGGTATFNATTSYSPQYGVTGYQTATRVNRVFRRVGTLIIVRPQEGGVPRPLFESRAVSEGRCGMLSALAPNLVDALFATFPAGGTRRVTSEAGQGC